MAEFFQMGGYAAFVWPSYALTMLVLWLNWYLPRKQHEKELRLLKRRRKAEKQ
ncbi:MAG: heme exporter protein CcmD [Gammaproteobacteria bacterium]|nr:MAG: heme exporter protein CcmD [Gammaproteobacteria bacterium]UCH41541.1 MAG: heme exporter protein CcmD [Gammaproteobacteria bacterium]